FEACLPITIHAGEGEGPEKIWAAAYHLHADRIGHGLSLASHKTLAARFRDRGICVELCPTSNREVVGFQAPKYPASRDFPRYPLRELWQMGLPLAICTDNPGISRTDLPQEFLAAARMCEEGLSHWEVLALIRRSFQYAFLPAKRRAELLREVDAAVYKLVQKDKSPS
ncbi:MAG: adenosine deaminase, partial [Planctomycetes bacterium]|nr:adenosine deaminase [Planctomycetota bacterium]